MRPVAFLAPSLVALVVAGLGLALTAGSRSGARTTRATVAGRHAGVHIKNYIYGPSVLTVSPGTRVTFTNRDASEHTATADAQGGFDTGTLNQGKAMTVVFKKAGTFSYHCAFHPFMHGRVVVK